MAVLLERDHGAGGAQHIFGGCAAAIAGDWQAVATWKAVADRFDQLREVVAAPS